MKTIRTIKELESERFDPEGQQYINALKDVIKLILCDCGHCQTLKARIEG